MAEDGVEEYLSSLMDLTVNSKPLINMLTMLAEENSEHASAIVEAIESHITKVSPDVKLPVLYLIDSIVKNVSRVYVPLFTNNIVQIFASVFEKVDEKTRMSMFKLRQTWNDIFPAKKMYTLDLRIQHMDQNWPTLSPPPTTIHVNPKFLNQSKGASDTEAPSVSTPPSLPTATTLPADMKATLLKKQQILQELQQKKRELELVQQSTLFDKVPQAVVRPVVQDDASKTGRNVTIPKATPRAVVMPPAPTPTPSQQGQPNGPASTAGNKTKIAPANSVIIAAAAARDPRLARLQAATKQSEPPKQSTKETKSRDPRANKKPPKESIKKRESPQKPVEAESEADLLEELLRQQKLQAAKPANVPGKTSPKKVPEVRVAEEEIQLRQRAMLKAPVLGQLNRKGAGAEAEKPSRRCDSPPRKDPRIRVSSQESPNSDKHKEKSKDSKSRRKPREKPITNNGKSENKPDRKRDRKGKVKEDRRQVARVDPQFSPEPNDSEPVPDPRPAPSPTSFLRPMQLETIMSSPSPEPPPPPSIGIRDGDEDMVANEDGPSPHFAAFKTGANDGVSFKKGAIRGRNYSRRNKQRSVSPSPSADVDLRVSTTTNTKQPGLVAEEVVDVGKDVDLRLLAMSSPKKRLSTEGAAEQPPAKRGKTDVDTIQLFGNKDMDERMPPRSMRTPPPQIVHSPPPPPPPPMISTTPPANSPLPEVDGANHDEASWADVKPRPKAEVKSVGTLLSRQLELEVANMEREDRERQVPPASPLGELDRLGRRLLYSRLPNDPRARRESLHNNEDHGDVGFRSDDRDVQDLHVSDILVQAKEQLARGTMSRHQYSELMAQIVRMNESQKIRDAQRQRRRLDVGGGTSPPYDGPQRGNYAGPEVRNQGRWRPRLDEDGSAFARRRGRGVRGGPGNRGRMMWRENQFPKGGLSPNDWSDQDSRSQEAWAHNPELANVVVLPPTDPLALDAIAADPVRHISIDGTPRAIRFYGGLAVGMLSFNSAREISFEDGVRRVFVAGLDLPCQLNGPPMPFMLQNKTHTVRLGAPTRELLLDDRFYEVHFGGAPVQVDVGGMPCSVQLEGPPPQVRIASQPTPFCMGSVLLIVNARVSFTIYLDAKPQRFEINGRPLVLKLTNRLKTVLINDVPVPLQFGGSAVPITFLDTQHFLRLTELPPGVIAGQASVRGMEGIEGSPMHLHDSMELPGVEPKVEPAPHPADLNRGIYMDLVSTMMGGASEGDKNVGFNYKVEAEAAPLPTALPAPPMPPVLPAAPEGLPLLQKFNINDLFQSLVATGIISKQPSGPELKPDLPEIKRVDFDDTHSLRESQPGVVALLYSGIQCGSCGVRFPPEETVKYSQHLDWHFRQNRRDRDAARRGTSRRWYYDVNDWIQFEEIEDLEERAQSWFETEGQSQGEEPEQPEEVHSVPAPSGGVAVCCHVCHDRFDTFYHEDTEEWHLRHCMLLEGLYYHPVCYQDSVKIPDEPLAVEKMEMSEVTAPPLLEPLKAEQPVKMEQSIVVLEDDEDDRDDAGDIQVLTADDEAVQDLVQALLDRVVMEEECDRSPIVDDELEVLAVTSKDSNKEPIDVIDVPETGDDEEFRPPSPAVFDPERKIKQEPLDEMESAVAQVDQTITSVTSSIDGNVEMAEASAGPAPTASKIKITFSKPLPPAPEPQNPLQDTIIDPTELQIQEIEPEPLPLKAKKPRIAEREMTEYPTCVKCTEISGLCSIM